MSGINSKNIKVLVNNKEIDNVVGVDYKFETDCLYVDIENKVTIKVYPHTEEFGKDMEFDVVIGNPPYQESTGGGNGEMGGKCLYDKFIISSMTLANIVCMITKNNWISSDTLKDIRNKMIEFGIDMIINYPIVGEVFSGVAVSVSILMLNKGIKETNYIEIRSSKESQNYKCEINGLPCIPSSYEEVNIIKKILATTNIFFNADMRPTMPFGIETNGKLSNGSYLDDSIIETDTYNIAVAYMDGKDITYKYTTIDNIMKNKELIDYYKIVCGEKLNKSQNVVTNIKGLPPHTVCTGSYSLLFYSKEKDIAYNSYKYINTKFFRILVYSMVDQMARVTPARFQLVPLQDFSSSSDIDWSQSISNIDQQLYKKYNLSDEEIAYIESTIKPMQ